MSEEELIKEMEKIENDYSSDPEEAHVKADAILLRALENVELKKLVEVYCKVRDSVGFWYA